MFLEFLILSFFLDFLIKEYTKEKIYTRGGAKDNQVISAPRSSASSQKEWSGELGL